MALGFQDICDFKGLWQQGIFFAYLKELLK